LPKTVFILIVILVSEKLTLMLRNRYEFLFETAKSAILIFTKIPEKGDFLEICD